MVTFSLAVNVLYSVRSITTLLHLEIAISFNDACKCFVDLNASYEIKSGLCIASSCLSVVSVLCVA